MTAFLLGPMICEACRGRVYLSTERLIVDYAGTRHRCVRPDDRPMTRRCIRCRKIKHLDHFPFRRSADGTRRYSRCAQCRAAVGEEAKAKVPASPERDAAIAEAIDSGVSHREIAQLFGLSHQRISQIKPARLSPEQRRENARKASEESVRRRGLP